MSLLAATGGEINERTAMVPFFVHFQIPAANLERCLTFVVQPEDFPLVLRKVSSCVEDMEHKLSHYLLGEDLVKRVSEDMETFDKCVVRSFGQWQGLVDEWKSTAAKKLYELQAEINTLKAQNRDLVEALEVAQVRLHADSKRMSEDAKKMESMQGRLLAAQQKFMEAEEKRRKETAKARAQLLAVVNDIDPGCAAKQLTSVDSRESSVKQQNFGPQVMTSPELPSMLFDMQERTLQVQAESELSSPQYHSDGDTKALTNNTAKSGQEGRRTGARSSSSAGVRGMGTLMRIKRAVSVLGPSVKPTSVVPHA